ncbi:MAG: HepT-like ribonuclease domain-containing protein [Candidatus Omnitrophota bacterium]
MINREEFYRRLDEIREAVNFLRKIKQEDLEIEEKFLLARYELQIILEAMFTTGNQIIANSILRKPTGYKDILTVLYENKILEKELYEQLIPFVGLRG